MNIDYFSPVFYEVYLRATRPVGVYSNRMGIALPNIEGIREKYYFNYPYEDQIIILTNPIHGLQSVNIPIFVRPVYRCASALEFVAYIVDDYIPDNIKSRPVILTVDSLVFSDDYEDRLKDFIPTLLHVDSANQQRQAISA